MIPTVGLKRVDLPSGKPTGGIIPTVGPERRDNSTAMDLLAVLQQITGRPVDQEAGDRLVANCRREADDCTLEEIVEIAWSKAYLCRSGKIDNPVGFLITQVPKHFQGEALQAYRLSKRKELDGAAAAAAREAQRLEEIEAELARLEETKRVRASAAERHRVGQGIDLRALSEDATTDEVLKEWARRMMKLGYRYRPEYT